VKFLTPKNFIIKKQKPTHLIFPQYKKGVKANLSKISECKALYKIKKAGYQLESALTQKSFEDILTELLILPKFSLQYSSLEDAIKILKEISNAKY